PDADPHNIALVGFGMGGMVAALTAALDDRVTACVSASGLTSLTNDTDALGAGGLRRWSHLYGWLPRLGAFVGRETSVPLDTPDILASIAPRPTLIVAPQVDWHHPLSEVVRVADAARKAYVQAQAPDRLRLFTPRAIAEFNNDIQAHVTDFLLAQAE